jgi:uncharacterized membrane protein
MGRLKALLSGTILGAGAMYFFDPRLGNRRRALLRDQARRLSRQTAEGLDAARRDLVNRARGTVAEVLSLVFPHTASDDVLCQRVRSVAGRHVSHPSALEVDVAQGCVVLRGPVLREEADGLIQAVGWTRGVRGVDNQLDVHDSPGDVPALQGEGRRPGSSIDILQSNWAPGTRLLVGASGALLLANCLARRRGGSTLLGLLGFGMLARSLANLDTGRTFGIGGGRRAIDIHKTIEIKAPVERVFDFFSTPENFPLISDKITNVQNLGNGRFTKEMAIPGGASMRCEERIVRSEPDELVETHSEPGSTLQYMKQLRFERTADNHTRLDVLFSYNPPGGVLAHAAAAAIGFDPKTLLEDLLMRAKSFLETGRQPHDAAVRQEFATPRGPGAPPEDVKPMTSHGENKASTWPPSPAEAPQAGGQAGQFPPAM